jgi:uncharacterized RDD family membrane protein YckC
MTSATPAPQRFRGERLGLPADGPGSITAWTARAAAFIVDSIASGLVAGLFVAIFAHQHGYGSLPRNWSLVPFALDYLIGLPLAGCTLGMYLCGLRVIRVDRAARVSPWQAFIRTVLLTPIIPAVITDRDGRGLHDRVAQTVVVRA